MHRADGLGRRHTRNRTGEPQLFSLLLRFCIGRFFTNRREYQPLALLGRANPRTTSQPSGPQLKIGEEKDAFTHR